MDALHLTVMMIKQNKIELHNSVTKNPMQLRLTLDYHNLIQQDACTQQVYPNLVNICSCVYECVLQKKKGRLA